MLSENLKTHLNFLKVREDESFEDVIWGLIKSNETLQNIIEDLEGKITDLTQEED